VRLDLHCEDPSEMAFAAFYADCVHEVLPVATGLPVGSGLQFVASGTGADAAAAEL
jgi:hypothetical protein